MEYINCPQINKKISRLALGTWSIGGVMWGGSEENESIATIHNAFEEGVTLIDTAPLYGVAEEVVGKALKAYAKRDQIAVATKAGLSFYNGKIYFDLRKQTLKKEIEASLKRLNLDRIDIYQVHWVDPLIPLEELAQSFEELKKEGKIGAIGVTNFGIEEMKKFRSQADLFSSQFLFNLYERDLEKTVLPYCNKNKIISLGYSPICRGLLSGTMERHPKYSEGDIRQMDSKFVEPAYAEYFQCTTELNEWAQKKHKHSVLSLSMRWCLDKGIDVVLLGARKTKQIKGISELFNWKLNEEDFKEIDQILAKNLPKPEKPFFSSEEPPPVLFVRDASIP